MYRIIKPIIGRTIRPVGKELWTTGMNILDDVNNRKLDFKSSLKNRLKESGQRLKRKAMDNIDPLWNNKGGGYKRTRKGQSTQNTTRSSERRTKQQKGRGRPVTKKRKGRKTVKKQKGRGIKKKAPKQVTTKKSRKKKKTGKKKSEKITRDTYDIFTP